MDKYFSWVLGHRLLMVAVIGVVSVLSALSLSRAVIGTSIGELFFGDSPAYAEYLDHVQIFGSDEVFLISYEEPDPLSSEALEKLEAVARQIEANPEVARTNSVLNLDRVQSTDGNLVVETYAEAARSDPAGRHRMAQDIRDDPLIGRTILAASGKQAALAVQLTVDPKRSGEIAPALVQGAIDAFIEQGYTEDQLHRVGWPAVIAELVAQTHYAIMTLFPIVILVMVCIVIVLFRSPLPVVLSMGVSLLSVLWTLGLATAVNPKLNLFHGIVPAVVTVVAVSDVIHLWSAYLHELRDGKPRDAAILASAGDVGRACLLTSVTTFVGFVSISLIPTPVFQQFGWALGLGVAIALLLAMTLVPIAATLGKVPSIRAQNMDNPVAGLVDRLVRISASTSVRYPRTIILCFMALCIASLGVISTMKIETNGLERLDESNRVRKAADMFRAEYTGIQSLDIFITSDQPDRMLDPDIVQAIAKMEQRVEDLPRVEQTLSYVDLLKRVHRELGGGGELPDTRPAIAQELLLFELGGGQALDPVLDFDRSSTHIALNVHERRMRAMYELAEEVESIAVEELPEDVSVNATGMIVLSGAWLDEIVQGQRNGVLASTVGIGMLMMIGLRSVQAGLWSMIPNLLPLLVVTAACGVFWGDLDSDTLVVLMMAIGIGVDDTIHFLTRLRTESLRSESHSEAISRTFSFAGRAIVMTTVILALGFAPLAMSSYYSMAILGTLLPLALVVAMLADLFLVPALAQVGLLRFGRKEA